MSHDPRDKFIYIYTTQICQVYHFFNCQCCLLLKNKCLQFRLATFPQKVPQYSILSGLDRCCTCNSTLIKSCWTVFITTIDMAPWSFLINYFFFSLSLSLSLFISLLSLSLSLSLSFFEDLSLSTVFKSFLVFIPLKMVPKLHIQYFSRTIKSFFSFTASTATIVRNPSWGSSGCLNFVTWSATPTFCCFFQFCVWFMVSPASFQVGCRSYIPLVVYFAHNNVNSIWALNR